MDLQQPDGEVMFDGGTLWYLSGSGASVSLVIVI